ncbi:ribonuclease 3-like protein 2 isoform X2 [Hibiscus syriacus]|uniref:ribonuclease 3-like protein 2 isoform X2 n=1 Tax=Hibiscus syriacus TaxID=106335 RepID=UPI0019229CB1|nr:ribonuclease 3-like protein 2 isoform X2 [Hibiscus syriacus]
MKHHFAHGVSDEVKMAFNLEVVVATVVLALLLHIFWRCCFSFYLNHVKKYISSCSSSSAAASGLEPSKIAAVEEILNYTFKDKRLLEEALTHSSCREGISYDRLEFLGDAALGLTVAIHFFRLEPRLNSDQLTRLRKKSVCNARLAYLAARLGLYRYVRRKDTAILNRNVKMYEDAVKQGNDHRNFTVRSPDILADVFEALAGAVYVDLDFDSTKLWTIFKDLLMVDQIKIPKDLESRKIINGAQDKLYGLCGRKKWGKPIYTCLVKEGRPQHETTMIYSVEIETDDGLLRQEGDEKYTPRDARNSAAYRLLRSLPKYPIM